MSLSSVWSLCTVVTVYEVLALAVNGDKSSALFAC